MQPVRQVHAGVDRAVTLTEQCRIGRAADANRRHRGAHLVALAPLMPDRAAERADAAFQQIENRMLASVLAAAVEVLGNPESRVVLHRHEAAIAEPQLRDAAPGLDQISGEDLVAARERRGAAVRSHAGHVTRREEHTGGRGGGQCRRGRRQRSDESCGDKAAKSLEHGSSLSVQLKRGRGAVNSAGRAAAGLSGSVTIVDGPHGRLQVPTSPPRSFFTSLLTSPQSTENSPCRSAPIVSSSPSSASMSAMAAPFPLPTAASRSTGRNRCGSRAAQTIWVSKR